MTKVKQILKNNIISFILGAVIFSGIGAYAATTISSSSVTYGNTTVSAALDDLINKTKVGTATAEDIASGKTALVQGSLVTGTANGGGFTLVDLGAGTSFDVSSYDGYENFTVDNFIVEYSASDKISFTGVMSYSFSAAGPSVTPSKSYDATTGVLTISDLSKSKSGMKHASEPNSGTIKTTVSATVTNVKLILSN